MIRYEIYLQLVKMTSARGIPLHMDGARLFNAAVYLQMPASAIVKDFASCSFCLSKNLGGPIGSMLVGSAEFIRKLVVFQVYRIC